MDCPRPCNWEGDGERDGDMNSEIYSHLGDWDSSSQPRALPQAFEFPEPATGNAAGSAAPHASKRVADGAVEQSILEMHMPSVKRQAASISPSVIRGVSGFNSGQVTRPGTAPSQIPYWPQGVAFGVGASALTCNSILHSKWYTLKRDSGGG